MEKILTFGLIAAIAILPFSELFSAEPEEKPAGTLVRKPSQETFFHAGTGLNFPARIGSFEKRMVRVNPLSEVGTDVAYENESGSIADVYLYQTDQTLPEHLEGTRSRILASSKVSPYITQVEEVHFSGPDVPEGVSALQFQLCLSGETLLSRLYLFSYRGFVVKVRVTWPESLPEESEEADVFGEEVIRLAFPSVESKNSHQSGDEK